MDFSGAKFHHEDGSLIPDKLHWTGLKFDHKTRTFEGTISAVAPKTFKYGAKSKTYKFVFNEDYTVTTEATMTELVELKGLILPLHGGSGAPSREEKRTHTYGQAYWFKSPF